MPAVKPLAESFANLRDMREDSVAQIRAKERRFRELAESPPLPVPVRRRTSTLLPPHAQGGRGPAVF
jgi:hypothetical protein